MFDLKRREFMTLLGSAPLWPTLARAQQPVAMPVIGFLHGGAPGPNARRLAGFRKGLSEAGFAEGKNVAIEFRWAEGKNDQLPEMAADLVQGGAAVIATLSSTVAAVAAKKVTSSVPIYFLIADPPVELGLVASLNRPGGNATGIITLAAEVTAKRFSLLRELVPQAAAMAALLQPGHPSTKPVAAGLEAAARTLGVRLDVLQASTAPEIEKALLGLEPSVPLLVGTDPFFFSQRAQLVAMVARRAVPAIYDSREFAEAGGLMSYGPNHVGLWQEAGGYVARILKGERPADLPVVQASKFEMVINLKTAHALGLEVPPMLLARADEVIE
jgi:putative tryptophan/tyrosine transport system substrate-binding protein